MPTINDPVGELVREMEVSFTSGGGVKTSKYVTEDLYEDISKIYAYLESKHISGEKDSLNRDKPFFNVVLGARNVWFRATDLDRKNVNVKATKRKDDLAALLATVHLQRWMRREDFGTFLNNWGLDLASFNSVIVKFVEQDGRLIPNVMPWNRMIVDPVDFDSNPKIEILELTEAQLRQRKNYDQDMVDKLCEALQARETTDKQNKDTKANYIKLYEVHLNGPLSYLTGKEKDEDTYVQQMKVISMVASKEKGQFDDFTLYSGREAQDPYMLTALLPNSDGSISLRGAVKTLFQTQWMLNHTIKGIKDQLDIASRQMFQTSDANFVGRNVLKAVESGTILIHKINEPLTQVNNTAVNITAQESFANMWQGLKSDAAGISETMLGNSAPAGTAWRQVEALLQESHSLFEVMTQNKALCLERMIRRFVIPYIKKKMDTSEEIAATLQEHEIAKIDSIYVPAAAVKAFNARATDQIFQSLENPNAPSPTPFDPQAEQQSIKDQMAPQGNQRSFTPDEIGNKTWKDIFKDLEWELEVDISGESIDKQLMFTTLNTALQTVVNPAYAQNPAAQLIVGKILAATGVISPIELSTLPKPQVPQQPVDSGNTVGLPDQQPTK